MATTYWSRGLIAVTLTLIPLTDVAWMLHLPNWWCLHPQRKVSSVYMPDEDTLDLLDLVVAPVEST